MLKAVVAQQVSRYDHQVRHRRLDDHIYLRNTLFF